MEKDKMTNGAAPFDPSDPYGLRQPLPPPGRTVSDPSAGRVMTASEVLAEREREVLAPRQSIIHSLQDAVQSLVRAYQQGIESNPMCADVAVFQKMTALQKELGAMMLEVNKMRGL